MAFLPQGVEPHNAPKQSVRQASHRARRGSSQLLMLSGDRQSLLQRFPIWPEQVLVPADWQRLFAPKVGTADQSAERLLAAGLLRHWHGQLRVALPVHGLVQPEQNWEQLSVFGQCSANRLAPFVMNLRQYWQSAVGVEPAWEQVAHNLLLGFLLGACGGQLLLELCQAPAAALLVESPGQSSGIWFSFSRLRPDLALVDLVGQAYPSADKLTQLLGLPDVRDTLASADDRGQLIIYGDRPLKLLRALAGYRETSPGPWLPHDYWLAWPTLTPRVLRLINQPLHLFCRALRLVVQELLTLLDSLVWPEYLQRVDLGLLMLFDLSGLLQAAWVDQGLLPSVAVPWLDGWQIPGGVGSVQEQMLRGL